MKLSIYTRTPPRKFCPLKGARLGRARDFQNGDFVLSRGGCVSQLCGKELRENEDVIAKTCINYRRRTADVKVSYVFVTLVSFTCLLE